VARIEPDTHEVIRRFKGPRDPGGLVVHDGALWIGKEGHDHIVRLDTLTGKVTGRVTVGPGAFVLGKAAGAIWAYNQFQASRLVKINPNTSEVSETFPKYFWQSSFDSTIWIAGPHGVVQRFDPRTDSPVGPAYESPIEPVDVGAGPRSLWIARWFHVPGIPPPCPEGPPPTYWGLMELDRESLTPLTGPVPFPAHLSPPLVAFGSIWGAAEDALLRLPVSEARAYKLPARLRQETDGAAENAIG
jgi:hypothetical protein